jgi:Fe-S-cluster containining protein
MEEAREIIAAAEDGRIKDRVIKIVERNLSDPTHTQCPFLSRSNQCTIYDNRPLECINFGRSAVFTTDEGQLEASAILKGERKDGLSSPGVEPRLCDHCQSLKKKDVVYPVSTIIGTYAAIAYYELQPAVSDLNEIANTLVTGEAPQFFRPEMSSIGASALKEIYSRSNKPSVV